MMVVLADESAMLLGNFGMLIGYQFHCHFFSNVHILIRNVRLTTKLRISLLFIQKVQQASA
ncbi:hypothetical protein HanRHA438_Chr08g0364181 [Helianthus annuus]|nr:hypothetical protein HanRHA438_Chr08g0364181 [Helianthus annuus]